MTAVECLLAVFLFGFAVDRSVSKSYNSCPAEYGSMKYAKVGCFNDRTEPSRRALKHLLFQDRDKQYTSTYSGRNITWKEWKTYLPELVCRCADAAFQNGQVFFAIQFHGECWTLRDANDRYSQYGRSKKCEDTEFQTCQDDNNKPCAGVVYTNYVYEIVPGTGCYQSHQPQCSLKPNPVGCFGDRLTQRALPELLLTARDPSSAVYFNERIDWYDWANFIDRFTCECARRTKEKNYDYFGIEFFGECWSGSNAWYNMHSQSGNCGMIKDNGCAFEECHEQRNKSKLCVGGQLALYVYSIKQPIDGGYTEWLEHPCSTTCGCGVRKLTRTCTNPPPQHGGTCTGESEKTEPCNLGRCAPVPCSKAIDMGILLGASRSLRNAEFTQMKHFVRELAKNFDLSGAARFGLITVNSKARLRLAFTEKDNQNLEQVKKILRNERLDNKRKTRIDLALQKANKELFTQTKNGDDKAKVLILVSDSKSYPRVDDYTSYVEPLKKKNVEMFAVAVGPSFRENELLSVESGKKERVFYVRDFHYLFNVLADVLRDVCEVSGSNGSGFGAEF